MTHLLQLAAVAPLTGALCLTSWSAPQGTPPPHQPALEDGYSVDWPAQLGSGSFSTGILAGTFEGAYPDLFVLRGDLVVRMAEVGLYDSFTTVSSGVVDLACLDGAGIQPGTDAVILVGANGVESVRVEPATGGLLFNSIDATNSTGARVETGDVDGDGTPDVAVLDFDGATLRFYAGSGSTWSQIGTLSLPGNPISDFALAQVDGAGGAELALAMSDGFEIHSLAWPGPISTVDESRHGPAFRNNQVERLVDHDPQSDRDGFAWATRHIGLGQWMVTGVTEAGIQVPEILPQNVQIVGMRAARFLEREGVPAGLLLSVETAGKLYGLYNLGHSTSVQAFSWTSGSFPVNTNFLGSNVDSRPILGDLDGDLYVDALLGNTAAEDMQVYYHVDPAAGVSQNPPSYLNWVWQESEYVVNQAGNLDNPGWLFHDNGEDVDGPDYTGVYAELASDVPLSTTEMTAVLWVDQSIELGLSAPDPQRCARCTDVDVIVGQGPDTYAVGLPFKSQDYFGQAFSALDQLGRIYLLVVKPTQPFPDGSQPVQMMALAHLDDQGSTSPEDALVNFTGFTVSDGFDASNVTPLNAQTEPPTLPPGTGGGTGIQVESVPIRRIKPVTPLPPPPTNFCEGADVAGQLFLP